MNESAEINLIISFYHSLYIYVKGRATTQNRAYMVVIRLVTCDLLGL